MGVKGDPRGSGTSSGPSGAPSGSATPSDAGTLSDAGAQSEASALSEAGAQSEAGTLGEAGDRSEAGAQSGAATPRLSVLALLRAHWLFALVLLPAIAMRVITVLGFRWALWFNDSYGYVADATGTFKPDTLRPSGYSIFLRLFEPLHSFATPVIVQHLMGLAIGVMVYALAVHRFRVPKPIAVLATVPALFDANQIQLEHLLMADVPFAFLVTAAATIVLWQKKPTTLQFALAGALLGVASITRTVGLPLLAVLAVYMLIQRAGWRRLVAVVVACLIPFGGYMLWFFAFYGKFAETEASGIFMYQRVMAFADCSKMKLPPEETALCTSVPPSQRPISQWYMWGKTTPLLRYPPPKFGPLQNRLGEKFAITAIESQPLDYADLIWHDTYRAFWWSRPVFPDPLTYAEYRFGNAIKGPSRKPALGIGYGGSQPHRYVHGPAQTQIVQPYADIMIWYQKHIWMPGTPLGAVLIFGLCGMALAWRRVGGEILLPWGLSAGLLVVPAATAEFDYRYVLPAVPFAFLAAAMVFGEGNPAGDRLLAWLERRRAARAIPEVPREPAAVDRVPSPLPADSVPDGDAGKPDGQLGEGTMAERSAPETEPDQEAGPDREPEVRSESGTASQSGSGSAAGGPGS